MLKNPIFHVELKSLINNFKCFSISIIVTGFMNISRSSRSQVFFKIGALKNFAIFWIKKRLQHRCFPVNIGQFLRQRFYRTSPVADSAFFKSNLTAISQRCECYDVLVIFSSQHVLERYIVWCIKSRTRLFINLLSIVRFSK